MAQDNGYRESLIEKPDKYLFDMIIHKQDQFNEGAIHDAQEILRERNVNIEEMMIDTKLISELQEKALEEEFDEKRKASITIGVLLIAAAVGTSILSYFVFGMGGSFIGLVLMMSGVYILFKQYKSKTTKK